MEDEIYNDDIVDEGQSEIKSNIANIENGLYMGSYQIGSEFIIYFNNDKEIVTKIKDINNDINSIFFEEDIILSINDDGYIKIKTEDYEIIEIYKIKPIDVDDLPKITDILLTKDIYPELKIEVKEIDKDKYYYSMVEKKESLISSIISSLNIYDNNLLIKKITLMVDELVDMIELLPQNDIADIIKTHFNDIHKFNENQVFLNWLHPVSNNKLKVYISNDEPLDEGDTYFNKYFEEELYNMIYDVNNSKDYFNKMNVYYNINQYPLQHIDISDGYNLTNYTGGYFRSCVVNECNYYGSSYSIDLRKNNNNLIFPNLIDNNYEKTIVGDTSNLNINGFLLFSENDPITLPFTLKTDSISLKQKSLLINNFYSNNYIRDKFLDIIKNNNFKEVITNDIYDYDPNMTYLYRITDTLNNPSELQDIMYKYIPNQSKIINNFTDNYLYNYLFNYNDIEKIFIKYDIKANNLNIKDKINFNNIIKENIEKYNDIYKIYYKDKIKLDKIEKDSINIIDKINIIKDYIYSELNQNIKLYYLKKFIDKFTRLPQSITEDKSWLYNKYNNEKILCKHHVIASKVLDDYTAYNTLIGEYGDKPKDGIIYCKNCKEYLAPEDYSIFEGFEDDKPIVKEELNPIKETVAELDPESIDGKNYELIKMLGNTIGIKLIDYDILEILNVFNNGFGLSLFYNRYNVNGENAIKSIAKIYNMSIKEFNIFFNYTNKILLLYCCIIIYIQTATPPYKSKNKIDLLKIDDDKFKTQPMSIINDRVIKNILMTIKKIGQKFPKDIMWQQVKIFNEFENSKIPSSEEQIKFVIKYLLQYRSFPQIYNRINKYQEFYGFSKQLKLKQYWSMYRPLYSNNTIKEINNVVNDSVKQNELYILKNTGTTFDLENISLLQSMDNYINSFKYEQLKINNIDILNNNSFYRLYEYIQKLYGKQLYNLYFNLLINRLLNTINNKEYFSKLFKSYGWNNDTNNIAFNKFRELLEIENYCDKKDKSCQYSLTIFKHISLNNTDVLFINTPSKRIYTYKSPAAYPNKNWDDLVKNLNIEEKECLDNPLIKNKNDCISESNIRNFFNKFCYDITGQLISKPKNEIRLDNLYINIDTTFNPCDDKSFEIEPNDKNFKKIINLYHKQNSILGIYYIKPKIYNYYSVEDINTLNKSNIIEKRILYSLYNYSNKCLSDQNCIGDSEMTEPLTKLYDLVENYIYDIDANDDLTEINKDYIKKYGLIMSNINNDYEKLLRETIESIKENDYIPYDLKNRINNNKFYDILKNVINNNESENYLTNIQLIYQYIRNMILTLSRIKNNDNIPNNFHSHISKYWNLSNYNKEKLKEFVESKELLLHNSVLYNTTDRYKGFYNYLINIDIANYFKEIFNIILPYTQNLGLLIGSNNNTFDQENAFILIKYIFILILNRFTIYINELIEEEDGPDYIDDKDNKIKYISLYLYDTILNIIQEYNDPSWYISINNKDVLQEKLRAQSEREKQGVINRLEQMDKDERYANIQLQNVGDGHWYQDAAKANAEFVNGPEWEQMNMDERREAFKEILEMNNPEQEINEEGFIQDFQRYEGEEDDAVGYDRGGDHETEGGDDDEEQLSGGYYE